MDSILKTCQIDDCEKGRAPGRKGWCVMHYTRWLNNGDPQISKVDRSIPHATKMSEYKSWQGIKDRCLKPNYKYYHRYGGRGITVCDEWRSSFATFLRDMGTKPGPLYTIDRIDNDKGYSKENCRWATHEEQSSNRRSNLLFTRDDETKTLKQWCATLGLKYKTVHARVNRGVPFEEALY